MGEKSNSKKQKIKINDRLLEIHEIKRDPLEITKPTKRPKTEETPLKRPKSQNTSKSLRRAYSVKRTVSQWKNMNRLVDTDKRRIEKPHIAVNTERFERLRRALENAEKEKEMRLRPEPSLEDKLVRKMEGDRLYRRTSDDDDDDLYATPLFRRG